MVDEERHSKILRNEMDETYRNEMVVALARRRYHLPNHSYCADLCQYITNTHPLFGLCCHHVDHPIGFGKRFIALLGSTLFGLTVSNIFFILILNNDYLQETIFGTSSTTGTYTLQLKEHAEPQPTAGAMDNNVRAFDDYSDTASSMMMPSNTNGFDESEWYVTRGMILMWTVGGSLHATFDIIVWYIHACACDCLCFKKCGKKFGRYLVLFVVLILLAIASFVILLRASITDYDNDTIYNDDDAEIVSDLESAGGAIELKRVDWENLQFLPGYLIEWGLALLVWYPIVSFIFFSGILGCFQLPVLGGRPREMKLETIRKLEYRI